MPPHAGHDVHPHAHQRVELDGETFTKPCNGRFWCGTCRDWFSAAPCKLERPLRLPAGWVK